jgi:PAB-dependent poly(A)-specific ribonuclease subunit 2
MCLLGSHKYNSNMPLQIDVASYLSAVAISPDGSYLGFGDADGMIHTLTSTVDEERVPLNGFEGKPIEWADTPEPLPDIDWDDRTYVEH